VTDDTGFCATGDTSSSGSSDNSQTCITEITGNCDPTNGFARLNPLNIGSSKTLGDWTVTVVSFEPNANSEVEAAQLADVVPGPGATFALIELRATYNGAGLGNASDLDVQIVGSDRQTYSSSPALTAPNPADSVGGVANGAPADFNVALQMPAAATGQGAEISVYDTGQGPVGWWSTT
jgi:hypothetical protein